MRLTIAALRSITGGSALNGPFVSAPSVPAPVVDGTITLDAATGAFEFVGRASGPQGGWQVVSPDGSTRYIRSGGGDWLPAGDEQEIVEQVTRAVRYLANDTTSDAVLTNRLRRGYVELVERSTEGADDNELTRYELEIDTKEFASDFPLQWGDYRDEAIPGVGQLRTLPMTIWLDDQHVLVRVDDGVHHWAWQRLTYSDQPFTPMDPSGVAVDVPVGLRLCQPEDGTEFQTDLETCNEALEVGRTLAVSNGLAAEGNTASADAAFTLVCRAIQTRDAVRTALLPANLDLAVQLDATGVCPGDLSLLEGSS